MQPKLTVVVPTLNRRQLLEQCLDALVGQATSDVIVRVFDSGSNDGTSEFLAGLSSPIVEAITDKPARSLFDNWSRALDSVSTPYLAVVADDDLWYSGYAQAAIDALDDHSEAALAFADTELLDHDGRPSGTRHYPFAPGVFDGLDYLEGIVNGENIIIDSSAAVVRTEALRAVGGLDSPHMSHDIIFNYQFRLAARHRFVRIAEPLVGVRQHEGQGHLESAGSLAAVGMTAERMEAAARLLASPRAQDPAYRAWLSDRLVWIGRLRSQYTADVAPAINDSDKHRLDRALERVLAVTAKHDMIAVAGEDLIYDQRLTDARTTTPFPSTDGHYGGVPDDDDNAIIELKRCIEAGATHLVVAWPSFWWLDYYHGLRQVLSNYTLAASNSTVVVYQLTDGDGDG